MKLKSGIVISRRRDLAFFNFNYILPLLLFRLILRFTHAEHAFANLNDHACVQLHPSINNFAVDISAVRRMKVFEPAKPVTHRENRVPLRHLGEVETDRTRPSSTDEVSSVGKFTRFPRAAYESRENHILTASNLLLAPLVELLDLVLDLIEVDLGQLLLVGSVVAVAKRENKPTLHLFSKR